MPPFHKNEVDFFQSIELLTNRQGNNNFIMKKHETKYLKDYRPPSYWIDKVDIQFDLNENETFVTSKMKIRRNLDVADKFTPLILDCSSPDLVNVIADDMVLHSGEYEVSEDFFKILRVPETFVLEIQNRLKPLDNTSLEGLYKSGGTFCTQCEAQGFRKITCFPDRPDVMTCFSCIITADKEKYPVLLSNGNLISKGDLKNGRHYAHWEDPFKKPSYLFALVAGDLTCIEDHFTTCSGRDVTLQIYVEHENKDKCGHAMESLKQAMKWDEDRFGREYDLDLYQIVAVSYFNMGAMENKGLNIFNAKYVLAKTETATDMDFMNIQGVVAHEYFHNWTGNRVTLKNWFQLSLKEGLTVFRDQEFTSDLNSRAVKRITDVKNLRTLQFPEDAGPMVHPVRPESYIEMNNFYTMTVYEKGAEVIRMIYELLGKESFRRGMDLYFERFDGRAVTTEDFVQAMEDAAGEKMDFSQFKLWYSQSGTPRITLKRSYDADKKRLSIHLSQTTPPDKNQAIKKPHHIPVKFGLIDSSGRDITPDNISQKNGLLHLIKEHQTFVFDNIPEETLPSLFRGFSAPVILKTDFTPDELAFLMAEDTDSFNRWDAAQQLYFMEIDTLLKTLKSVETPAVSPLLIKAFKSALTNQEADRALTARTITLPDENEIAQNYDPVDVEGIHLARKILKQGLALELKDNFMDLVNMCSLSPPHDLSHSAMADRSLKNAALSYIGSIDTPESHEILDNHFYSAQNMTDEIGALAVLCNMDYEFRDKALRKFYSKWHNEPLVIDKWFTVQACSTLPGTLENIKALAGHNDFSWKNPNRVRSLINAFAMLNPFVFHKRDGQGYTFLADAIIHLDPSNPMVTARLASAFNRWKRYDSERQTQMKKELERIMEQPNLSRDVFEIVSKALG